jgi:hypothetical protein
MTNIDVYEKRWSVWEGAVKDGFGILHGVLVVWEEWE